MSIHQNLILATACFVLGGVLMAAEKSPSWDGKLVQYGKMHEAIGQQQHQGRVQIEKLIERPHFFGVGALENLAGEITIADGKITVTRVNAQGQPEPGQTAAQATMLVGAYVPAWSEHKVASNVKPEDLDRYLTDVAQKAGLDAAKPFAFTVEGEFSNLRLHVIHGACPIHARLHKITLPKQQQPFELEVDKVRGTLVGVFAKDAVGNITHPDTSTHTHLVFKDAKSGKTFTGHVEQFGLIAGATVRVPK